MAKETAISKNSVLFEFSAWVSSQCAKNIPDPFEATRYHSLLVKKETLPDCFEITAWTDQDEIMGIRHKEYMIEAVQFHPESILTKHGKDLLKNFITLAKKYNKK